MKFKKLIYLCFLLIVACNIPKGVNQQEQPITEVVSVIEETQLSNEDSTVESMSNKLPIKKTELKNQFANKSYFLTSDYDFETCDALARCDCCSSELYFIDSYNYVY